MTEEQKLDHEFRLPDEFRWNWGKIVTEISQDEELREIALEVSRSKQRDGRQFELFP